MPTSTHPLSTVLPPHRDRTGLTASARHLLARIDRDADGAAVHHWVETPDRERVEPCPWCADLLVQTASVEVTGAPSGTYQCCTDHVADVIEWVATDGVAPERLVVDVALTPNQAHGTWAA